MMDRLLNHEWGGVVYLKEGTPFAGPLGEKKMGLGSEETIFLQPLFLLKEAEGLRRLRSPKAVGRPDVETFFGQDLWIF
ncbi:MAG: hypothetical protein MPW14_06640 [Candidatus Manganitrophus sp.]|nr:MAG: hypothetical protein MPW14_06640 [Candidatus Manganitrophus sp.]